MISKNEISSVGGAAGYFDKSFNQDGLTQADNYYVGEKANAIWQGAGSEILGIEGQAVKKEDFVNYLEGKLPNPSTGEIQDLAKNSKGENRQFGVDFTVAPPKSVSIVALVGQDERVVEAHLDANKRALAWLENNASVVRIFDENKERVAKQVGNLLYATVAHETNRNNEPHLHSHNVIVSAVFDKDSDKWRSLTNEQLYILRQSADVVYKTELAAGLQRAGYQLTYDKNGVDFEIAGMSREQIEAYSTRTTEIVKALKDRGLEYNDAGFQQQQIATLDTRAAKKEQPREILQSVWQDVADVVRLDVGAITKEAREKSVEHSNMLEQPGDAAQQKNQIALKAVSWATAHLSEREQSFTKADLEIAALKFGGGRIDQIEAAVNQKLAGRDLVAREISGNGAVVLTTNMAIKNELEYVQNIRDGIGKGKVVLSSEDEFSKALKHFEERKTLETGKVFKLSGEQIEAAQNLLMHRDIYQGVQGDAGTGKTAALEMVREVTESKGWIVMGVATTSDAAKNLESSSGIPSQTVAGYLSNRDNALKLAKLELNDLNAAMAKNEKSNQPRIEVHKLSVKADGIEHGTNRYVFDNERGDVFKSKNNLRSQLGNFLLDVASKQEVSKSDGPAIGESLFERLREKTTSRRNELSEAIGKRLISYEKVGVVESISAHSALFMKKDQELEAMRFKAGEKRAEITNLEKTGNKAGKNIFLVMDEASMTGIKDANSISRLVKEIGVQRVVFQGDVKQHGSVPAGRAFEQAFQAGMNKSVLQETRRFDNAEVQTKKAVLLMNDGKIAEAISKLYRIEVSNEMLHATVAQRYLANYEELQAKGNANPIVGVVTVINEDRKQINKEVHNILLEKGYLSGQEFTKQHLDNPKLTNAEQLHSGMLRAASVDHLIFRKQYEEIGVKEGDVVKVKDFSATKNTVTIINSHGQEIPFNPKQKDWFTPAILESRQYAVGDKVEARSIIRFMEEKTKHRIDNGERGVVSVVDDRGVTIKWSGNSTVHDKSGKEIKHKPREVRLDNNHIRYVDLSYARTTFKEQGATTDREIIAISKSGAKVFNEQAAYVAGTRAKDNTEIVTSDYETMLKNSGKSVEKSTAIDVNRVKLGYTKGVDKNISIDNERLQEIIKTQDNAKTKDKEISQERSRNQGHVLE